MASPLLNLVRNEIKKGFQGQLLPGTLRRKSPGTVVDGFGDVTSSTFSTHTFNGMVDTYSAFYRKQAGIPDTDVKILIIAGSLAVEPQKDDQVKIRDTWYQLRDKETDPAIAAWECQGYEIPDPTA